MYIPEITERIIIKYLKEMQDNKAPGLDNINTKHLKQTEEVSSKMLRILINKMIAEETIPSKLKIQVIRPIFKSGIKTDPKNYRPIAILSVIEKVYEKYLHETIYRFVTKNNLLIEQQHAYQKSKNTRTILKNINNIFSTAIGDNLKIGAVFIDLSKAFDTIDRDKLLQKLETYGIRGKMQGILKNYFENRKICTRIKETYSNLLSSKYGVPQGSCLGPLLFILYINDITDCSLNGEIAIYADDIMIYYINKDKKRIKQELQTDLDKIEQWAYEKDLFINTDKTKAMWLKNFKERSYKKPILTMKSNHKNKNDKGKGLERVEIENVNSYKYLGIHIDDNMLWKKQAEEIMKKMRTLTYKIKGIENYLSEQMKKIIYGALVTSTLSYGMDCYIHGPKEKIKKIEKMQDKLVKILSDKKEKIPKEQCYEILNTLPLQQMYCKLILLENFENPEVNIKVNNKYNTRTMTTGKLQKQKVRNRYEKRSTRYLYTEIYNKIPKEILETIDKKELNKKIYRYLNTNPIEMIK